MPSSYRPFGGGGNATVPDDAPIQPPQAFVDNIAQFYMQSAGNPISLASKGITVVDGTLLANWCEAVQGLGNWVQPINLSANALTVASVNAILIALAAIVATDSPSLNNGSIDLSGQTPPATPTGTGIIAKAALVVAGWTVTTD